MKYPVTAVLVTRGNVDMQPVLDSLPFDDVIVWNNSYRPDSSVYGRYLAVDEAKTPFVYVQDDDCVLEPRSIERLCEAALRDAGKLVANMPERFRHDFYAHHCLVGFGAVFPRELPRAVFKEFWAGVWDVYGPKGSQLEALKWFNRTCDIPFTAFCDRKLVDVPYADREFASDSGRMWKQTHHQAERNSMYALVEALKAAAA